MRLNAHELELRKVPFDVAFRPGSLDLAETKFTLAGEMRITGSAESAGPNREIRVTGRIKGSLIGECARCLETAPLQLDREFDLLFRPVSLDEDAPDFEFSEDESDIGYYEGSGLLLSDVVREQILLWLPMQWTCRTDCRGICPACGANRNTVACGCQQERVDERWDALRNFRPSARDERP